MTDHPLGPAASWLRDPSNPLVNTPVTGKARVRRQSTEAERAERQRRWDEQAARDAAQVQRYTVLVEAMTGQLRKVAELHAPVSRGSGWCCDGCDAYGYEVDQTDWPCSTADILLGEDS